jgi:ubiquinone/menaquinone biosynthesis C-methylase UbiE
MKPIRESHLAREAEYWEDRIEFEWLSERGIQSILDIVPPVRGDVLELCSGSGMFTKRIPDRYDSYTCLDLSGSLLERLYQVLPQIRPVQGNAEDPDFPPASFDMVLVFAGLHHLPDEVRAVRNGYNLLRTGGSFVAFEPNLDCWYRKPMLKLKNLLKLYTEDERFLSPQDVYQAMETVGFKNIQTKFETPEYNPAHLSSVLNKLLWKLMHLASSLGEGPAWQSFFVIIGKK